MKEKDKNLQPVTEISWPECNIVQHKMENEYRCTNKLFHGKGRV